MLPPKDIQKDIQKDKIETETSTQSTGELRPPATTAENPDALRPWMCSRTEAQAGDQGFFEHFHRSSRIAVLNPASAARLIRSRISRDQEELWVLALSAAKTIVGVEMIFRGTVDACMVHPRDIIRYICEMNAGSYIVAHNHPSGELEPSEQDWDFTLKLIACGEMVEIPLLDHIVVTAEGHTSMASIRPAVFNRSGVTAPSPEHAHPRRFR